MNSILNDIYKAELAVDRIGTGSTADALRYEKMTGMTVNKKLHGQPAQDRLQALRNWIANNPNASASDIAAANSVACDLQDAINYIP